MKTKFLIFAVSGILSALTSFGQSCPCVKTQVIGNDPDATFAHNNVVKAMDDTTIAKGCYVLLRTITCVGTASWYVKGADVALDNPEVSPITTTEFVVKSTLPGCPDVYDTVKISVSERIGLNSICGNGFEIFPNPTSGELTLNARMQVDKIEVADIEGRTILTFSPPYSSSINISRLKAGTYFIKVYTTDSDFYTRKILKN